MILNERTLDGKLKSILDDIVEAKNPALYRANLGHRQISDAECDLINKYYRDAIEVLKERVSFENLKKYIPYETSQT